MPCFLMARHFKERMKNMEITALKDYFSKDEYRQLNKMVDMDLISDAINIILGRFNQIKTLSEAITFQLHFENYGKIKNIALNPIFLQSIIFINDGVEAIRLNVPNSLNEKHQSVHEFKRWLLYNYKREYEMFKKAKIKGIDKEVCKSIQMSFLDKKNTLILSDFDMWYKDLLNNLSGK